MDIQDFNWDDGEVLEPEEQGRKRFGKLKMYSVPVKKVYQKGAGFTVDGIPASDFDVQNGKEKDGLKVFGGYEKVKTSKVKLFILSLTLKSQDGSEYQMVKQYPNQVRKEDFFYWGELVFPALKELPDNYRKQLMSNGLWCELEEVSTGQEFNGNDIKYWTNIVPHNSEKSLRKAESEFFGQFNEDTVESADYGHYPKVWESDPASLQQTVLEMKDKDHKEIVEEAMLEGEAIDGSEVNVKALLAELLDIPEPMVKL